MSIGPHTRRETPVVGEKSLRLNKMNGTTIIIMLISCKANVKGLILYALLWKFGKIRVKEWCSSITTVSCLRGSQSPDS